MFTLVLYTLSTVVISTCVSVWVTAYLVRRIQLAALAAVVEEVTKMQTADARRELELKTDNKHVKEVLPQKN